jgi:hypothetical protein
MPEEKIRVRGGAKRWRTVGLPGGEYMRVAVVPKAGPRGGHTIGGEKRKRVKVRSRVGNQTYY